MNQQQLRLEVQGVVLAWALDFMQSNNIPPSMMEDAFNKVLLELKDEVIKELLLAQQAQAQQAQVETTNTENVENDVQ